MDSWAVHRNHASPAAPCSMDKNHVTTRTSKSLVIAACIAASPCPTPSSPSCDQRVGCTLCVPRPRWRGTEQHPAHRLDRSRLNRGRTLHEDCAATAGRCPGASHAVAARSAACQAMCATHSWIGGTWRGGREWTLQMPRFHKTKGTPASSPDAPDEGPVDEPCAAIARSGRSEGRGDRELSCFNAIVHCKSA